MDWIVSVTDTNKLRGKKKRGKRSSFHPTAGFNSMPDNLNIQELLTIQILAMLMNKWKD